MQGKAKENIDFDKFPKQEIKNAHTPHLHRYGQLHGRNPHWWKAQSAQERHDYRYSETELQQLAALLNQRKAEFDRLYLYFQNTTNSHSFYNIESLKGYLANDGFKVKETPKFLSGQQSLF